MIAMIAALFTHIHRAVDPWHTRLEPRFDELEANLRAQSSPRLRFWWDRNPRPRGDRD